VEQTSIPFLPYTLPFALKVKRLLRSYLGCNCFFCEVLYAIHQAQFGVMRSKRT
jgi:hypothetical protein